jgi:hypothetical protein
MTRIDVNYSGGGDSGSVESIELVFDEKVAKEQQRKLDAFREVFEEELAQPIWDKHGSFADGGGYSVDGVVTYKAKDKTVYISGTDHYWGDYDSEENENEEDLEQSRDEEWEDLVAEKTEVDAGDDSYDFVCFYAKHVIGGRLPEEFHNQILFAAADGDPAAKKYIKEMQNASSQKN